uniref:Uncharacterized protein n=1 Tax=Micrurus corallinus TaxID=54390 RepID=A0A2D4GMU1_MICCO
MFSCAECSSCPANKSNAHPFIQKKFSVSQPWELLRLQLPESPRLLLRTDSMAAETHPIFLNLSTTLRSLDFNSQNSPSWQSLENPGFQWQGSCIPLSSIYFNHGFLAKPL